VVLFTAPRNVEAQGCWLCVDAPWDCTTCYNHAFLGWDWCVGLCSFLGCYVGPDCEYIFYCIADDIAPDGSAIPQEGMLALVCEAPADMATHATVNCKGWIVDRAYAAL
jgi:hypothetical protein